MRTIRLFPVLLAALFCLTGCSTPTEPPPSVVRSNALLPLQRFEFTQAQMGMEFRVVLYSTNELHATTAVRAAFGRIAQLNDVLSDYDSDSELSRLARTSGTGQRVRVGPDLWRVLAAGQALAEETGGAFDLTVGPSVNLWRRARRDGELPSVELLNRMHQRVGHRNLRLFPAAQSAELLRPDMRLDAGGIAKGYAMDEALSILHLQGVQRAMIQAGGDMVFADAPPDDTGWRVTLEPLDVSNPPRPVALVLTNCALATSGDLFQRLEINGVRYSHIVDPRTGVGLTDHSRVHVVAPDGLTADSLSTAVSVLGAERAIPLLESRAGVEAVVFRNSFNGVVRVQTSGWSRLEGAERPAH